jgi:FMN phosphatase YigB (HAD superfamily)
VRRADRGLSDIHYHLAPLFEYYGLGQFIDGYTLSFEDGIQKPNPRLFELALEQLGVTAVECLMVGDRPKRDGGAAAVGIATLICRLFRITPRADSTSSCNWFNALGRFVLPVRSFTHARC